VLPIILCKLDLVN